MLHKGLWKFCVKQIEPYVTKFYGVLPARVDFLKELYGLPDEKCELLVMGADDVFVNEASEPKIRDSIRKKYGIRADDFLIMTGGKIDAWKTQTLLLMKAVSNIPEEKVRLIVFGSVSDELQDKVNTLVDGKKVQFIGWMSSKASYELFASSDLVIFPGRHSVFWEQVAGQGIPMIVKDWKGTHHVDLGGNVRFLRNDSVDEIKNNIEDLFTHKMKYEQMKNVAENKGKKYFSYFEIAKKAIDFSEKKVGGRDL